MLPRPPGRPAELVTANEPDLDLPGCPLTLPPKNSRGVICVTDLARTVRQDKVTNGISRMSLHHSIARESATTRRLWRCAPLLVVAALSAATLAPGLIAGDRPFQRSLCGNHEALDACAQVWRTAVAELGEMR